jgi:hypothetical protein
MKRQEQSRSGSDVVYQNFLDKNDGTDFNPQQQRLGTL